MKLVSRTASVQRPGSSLGFSILRKDTVTRRPLGLGIEPLTFRSLEQLLSHLWFLLLLDGRSH